MLPVVVRIHGYVRLAIAVGLPAWQILNSRYAGILVDRVGGHHVPVRDNEKKFLFQEACAICVGCSAQFVVGGFPDLWE